MLLIYILNLLFFIESASYTWLPTCSKECAELIKEREIKKLQNKIDRIKKYKIKKNAGNY